MIQEQTMMMKMKLKLKKLVIVCLIIGSVFVQWNGQKSLANGKGLFKDNWMLKSVVASAVIEIVYILAAFRFDETRHIAENTEGLTIFILLHLISGALMKYYDAVPLNEKGIDLSPGLMPIFVLVCSVICKGTSHKSNNVITAILLTFGASLVTLGISKHFSIYRMDYMSFSYVFLTVMKLLCLKHFQYQGINISLRTNAIVTFVFFTAFAVPILEFIEETELGTFFLVSSISGLTSIGLLILIYNHVLCKKTVLETSSFLMIGYLLHQIIQSESISVFFVFIGICILTGSYIWHNQQQQEVKDTKLPVVHKDITVSSHELFTRMEFILFLGGVIATFLYVLPPRVSSRDINNLSYVGLDKIVRKLLVKTPS